VEELVQNRLLMLTQPSSIAYHNLLQARNIAKNERAENELVCQKNLLAAVIESTPRGVFAKDAVGAYRMINGAAARLLGYDAEKVISRTDEELIPGNLARAFRENDALVISRGLVRESVETIVVQGVTRTLLMYKTPWRNGSGGIIGVIGIGKDITDPGLADQNVA